MTERWLILVLTTNIELQTITISQNQKLITNYSASINFNRFKNCLLCPKTQFLLNERIRQTVSSRLDPERKGVSVMKSSMAQYEIVQEFSSLFDELREPRTIEAKYNELHVDCSSLVTAVHEVLATDASDTSKLSQIFIMVEIFRRKHLTGEDSTGDGSRVTAGPAESNAVWN